MNKFNNQRSASALLLTLLFLIGIGGIVITVTRLVLESSRIGANNDDYQVASNAADSGIQGGLLYLTQNLPGANKVGPTTFFKQGFNGSDCGSLTALDTTTSQLPPAGLGSGCSWFIVTVSPKITANTGGTILGDSDLPSGTSVTFNLTSSGGVHHLIIGSSATALITCSSSPAGSCSGTYGAGQQIPFSSFTTSLTLTRSNGASLGAGGITVDTSSLTLARVNYDCVSVTGHSGNVIVNKRLVRLYGGGVIPNTELEGSLCTDHLPNPS